ncbi:MAG: DUF4136 domain-containing protein [Sandaracinobacteroides sp.]
MRPNSPTKSLFRLVAIAGLALLAACAQPFEARVQSFQSMPPAQGQTFTIVPVAESNRGSLEFAAYAGLVATQLQRLGFQPAANPADAYMTVQMDFGAGPGRERLATRPSTASTWGWYGRGWSGSRNPWWGNSFYDPFWGPGWNQPEVYSFSIYPAYLEILMKRTADKTSLFEGRAETTTRVNDLPATMPNLVTALFTDFPGAQARSGVIRVPPSR